MTPSFFFQWRLASSSSSFIVHNDVGHRRHCHKSVISHHFKVWWRQAVTSLWRFRTSSNHHFYQSRYWRLPLIVIIDELGGRDSGNDFFVPQFSGGSVTFPGTRKRNKNVSFRFLGYPKITDHRFFSGTRKRNEKKRDFRFYYYF